MERDSRECDSAREDAHMPITNYRRGFRHTRVDEGESTCSHGYKIWITITFSYLKTKKSTSKALSSIVNSLHCLFSAMREFVITVVNSNRISHFRCCLSEGKEIVARRYDGT